MLPTTDHYWLINAHVPTALLADGSGIAATSNLAWVDLEIKAGRIAQIVPAGLPRQQPWVDLRRGLVWCGFVDLHSHLDKGHIWPRRPNPDGSFAGALSACQADQPNWQAEEVYRRMEFGLKCAYAHGTQAIRTHIDAAGEQAAISLEVFRALQQDWADRIQLQAVSLVSIDYFSTPAGEKLADQMAAVNGLLGGLPQMGPDLDRQLDRLFALAQERQLDLDFHTDESGNPQDITLRHVAQAAVRQKFEGQIICGHCCSLAVQSAKQVQETLNWLKQTRIGIVSLPMCNLYLQDRNQTTQLSPDLAKLADPTFQTRTPRWRGVTLVHELKQAGIPVAFASDNCRDPFYAYGDHDGLEVFTQAVRIAQLDAPYGDWCQSVTTVPAQLMGLPQLGRIAVGQPADLILFKARYFHELLARPQADRIVLRQGCAIDSRLPDYAELDDLW
jgi:cytosine/creatinine deaminase